jgi:UDP-2,4-diacetamido-2,4,6-trideoxy-beta-L-altropyranose hydrolase
MRCLTLANSLREQGATCRFICREHPGNLFQRIRECRFELFALGNHKDVHTLPLQKDDLAVSHESWLGADWKTDAFETLAAIGDEHADWLIVDHYAIDYRWEAQLRSVCKRIMVIDDLADRNHDCDLLLDQNLVTNWQDRYAARVRENCCCLLGPDYALLQPQYSQLHPRIPPRIAPVQRIFVYFGGADHRNLTGLAIDAFISLGRPDIAFDVVINPDGEHAETTREKVRGHVNIVLHENLASLAHLMGQADLAIGAGGATSWERCCLGLPSIVVTLAENQRPIAFELDRLGFVRWIGDQENVTSPNIAASIQTILENTEQIQGWSERCRGLLNGHGATIVTQVLSLNSETHLAARVATPQDESLILRWANDPLVRKNAFNPERIDARNHKNWFYSRLRRPESCRIYILQTDDDLPIGQVRFERCKGDWEIHYGLAAYARGRRLGVRLLEVALQHFRQWQRTAHLFGRVQVSNLPSQRVFERMGFEKSLGAQGELVYRIQY